MDALSLPVQPPPSPAETRDWSELPLDALSVVFTKLGAVEVLMGAGLVCHSWLDAAKVPELWRCVSIVYHMFATVKKPMNVLRAMAKVAVDRSAGRLEMFDGMEFIDDDLLIYIAGRSPYLKRLFLVSCCRVSKVVFSELLRKCPMLEDLALYDCGDVVFHALDVITGESCPQLKYLELSTATVRPGHRRHDERIGIATAHQLQHLYMEGVGIDIDNEDLTAIVDGCPHLELLVVRDGYNLDVNDALRAKCAGIKMLRLPCYLEGYDEHGDYFYYDRHNGYYEPSDDYDLGFD